MESYLIPAALVLIVTNISFAWLAARNGQRAEVAQQELARLVALSRPRSPQPAAGYDTGLLETSSPEPAGTRALG